MLPIYLERSPIFRTFACLLLDFMRNVRFIHLILIFGCLLGATPSVVAQGQGGGASVYHFMGLPYSARLNALGGENVAIRDADISMSMMNPALLNGMTDKVLQLNYAYYFQGTMFGSVLYGHNFGRSKVERQAAGEPDKPNCFAVGIHYLDYGRIKEAGESGVLSGATYTAKDIMIDLMYARQISPNFSVGVTLKPVYSIYESYSAFAMAADVGGHFQLRDSTLQIGLALRNIGWQLHGFYTLESGQMRESLPLNLELGLSYRFKHAPIRLSMTIHNMQRWNLSTSLTNAPTDDEANAKVQWYDMMFRHTIFAIDILPKSDRFWLTLSYNHRRRAEMMLLDQRSLAGFAFGGGVRIYKFSVAFAMSQYTKSNFTYQATLSLDINSMLQ